MTVTVSGFPPAPFRTTCLLAATWAVTSRLSFDFGYSHFFAGDWYATNPTPNLFNGDADFYYVQGQLNF